MPTVHVPQDEPKPDEKKTYRIRDSLREDEREMQRDGLLRMTVRSSREIPPELAARVLKQRSRTGITEDLIVDHLDEVEALPEETNWVEFRRKSPKVGEWYSKSKFHVAVAREDLKALGDIERLYYRIDDSTQPLSDAEVEAAARAAAKRKAPVRLQEKLERQSSLGGLGAGGPNLQTVEQEVFREELRDRRREEAYHAGVGPLGLGGTIARRFFENPAFLIPFGASVVDAAKAEYLWSAAKAKLAGQADEDQEDAILRYARLVATAERRGEGVLGMAAGIIAELPAVAGEFALTGGAYRGVKVGAENVLQSAMKEAISGATRRALLKTGGVIAGGLAQTAAMSTPRIVGGTFERMLPGVSVTAEQDGKLRAVLDPEAADSFGVALVKSVGVNFVETISERAGAGVKVPIEKLIGPLKKAVTVRWLKLHPDAGVDGFLDRVAKATGWHGVIAEVFEERLSEIGKTPFEGYHPPTADQLAAEVLAFGVPGAVRAGAVKVFGRRERAEAALEAQLPIADLLRATVETVKALKVAELAPEQAEDALRAATRDTGGQFVYADARGFQEHFQAKRDEAGRPIDPRELAERIGVDPKAYDEAVQAGGDLKLETPRAAMELVRGGHEEYFQNDLRLNPFEQSRRETEGELKRQTEEEKASAEQTGEDAGRLYAQDLALLRATPGGGQVQVAPLSEEALKDAESRRDRYANGALLEEPDGSRWKVQKNSQGDGFLVLLNDDGTESGTVYDLRSPDALKKIARTRVVAVLAEQFAGGARRIREGIETALSEAGFKREAKTYGAFVESAFRTLGARYGIDPEAEFGKYNLEIRRKEAPEQGAVGETFEQPAEAGAPRGRLRIGPNLEVALDLFKKADRSTFPHEFFGHFYLNLLGDLAERETVSLKLKRDYRAILDYLGAKSRAEITKDQHEKWARTIERHLLEGKAPSKELRGVFYRFFEWLTDVYRAIKETYFQGIEISPELRNVLDRLLATDEEIEAARAEEGIDALFADAKTAGATDAEAERYAKLQSEIREAATARMLDRVQADIRRENEEWWDKELEERKAEVGKEVDERPVYRALSVFKTGRLPDGSPVLRGQFPPGTQTLKLSGESVLGLFSDPTGTKIPDSIPRYVYGKDGVHPDIAAEWLGFASGAELLQAISEAEPRDELIERLALERMRAEYGEQPSAEEMREQAVQALHGDAYAELLALEMQILARESAKAQTEIGALIASRVPRMDVIREEAIRAIDAKNIREIDPRMYQAAERRAAKRAVQAMKKGDRAGALRAKAEQLRNAEYFTAATAAKEAVDEALVSFRRLYKSDERLANSRDVDLVDAARAILARINIGKADRSASSYLAPIKRYDPELYETLFALVTDAGDGTREYKDLTYAEFKRTKEAVDALWDLSLRTKQFEAEGKKLDIEDVAFQLTERLKALKKPDAKKGYDHAVTKWEKAKLGLMGIRASLRRVESWVDAMDGGDHRGAFRKFFWTPISEAADKTREAKRRYDVALHAILKEIEKDFTADKIEAPEINYRFGDNGSGFAELFGALLHTGNPSNKQKLLRGYGWGEFDAEGALDTSRWDAFRERMIREGKVRKEHYEALQKIWDLTEAEKPAAQRAHRDMYGFYFEEVTAEAIETPWGSYRGGYVPAKADPFRATDAQRREEREALERNDNSFAFPTTGRGATRRRSEAYAAPLQIDVRYLRSHFDWLARFIHLEPRVKDVARLLHKREFRAALDAFDPVAGNDMLVPWLQRAAQQLVETPMKGNGGRAVATIFRELRRRTGTALMMGNVTNALQNLTGLSLGAVKVKPRHLRDALWRYVRAPKEHAEAVREKSLFMRNRTDTEMAALLGDLNEMLLNPNAFEKAKGFSDRHAMFLQRATQNVIDNIVWPGAYDQAVENGATEEEAVREANSAVRLTQGSGAAEDVSRAETGTAFVRLFTQFWGYFNMQANLLGTEFVKVARGLGLKNGAGRALYVFTMGFMAPAVLAETIVRLSRGAPDDDDEDGYMDEMMAVFFGAQGRTLAAMIPGGSVLRTGWNAFSRDNWYDDRIQTSPAVSVLESAAKAPASVYRAIAEGGRSSKAIKDTLTLLSLLSGLPLSAVARPIGYLADVAEGEAEPSGPIDFTRGLLTGKPGAEK